MDLQKDQIVSICIKVSSTNASPTGETLSLETLGKALQEGKSNPNLNSFLPTWEFCLPNSQNKMGVGGYVS